MQRAQDFFKDKKQQRQDEIKSITDIISQPITFSDASAYCSHCKLYTVAFRLVQSKKRDEAETAIYQCLNCGEGKIN